MMSFKSFPILIICFAVFQNVSLLIRSPVPGAFSFTDKILLLFPGFPYCFISFRSSSGHTLISYTQHVIQISQKAQKIII